MFIVSQVEMMEESTKCIHAPKNILPSYFCSILMKLNHTYVDTVWVIAVT